jgi:formylglycine-generating enzyme required for sulfatase activity
MRWYLPIMSAVLIAGCSGSPSGGVTTAVSLSSATFVVLDLASGTLETRVAIPDLTTNPEWRMAKLVFRRLPTTSGTVGAPSADLGTALGDTPVDGVRVGATFLAVFELTQSQWTALGGAPIWNTDQDLRAAGGDVVAPGAPAFGISRTAATSVCSSYSAGRHFHLALPSGTVWELACRAGNGVGWFAWGDAMDPTTVRPFAAVFETQAGQGGPRQADGSRLPNAFGYYDLHGNVWEWLAESDAVGDGLVVGGSWNDTVPLARCSNRLALDPDVAHPLVGVRLVLVP